MSGTMSQIQQAQAAVQKVQPRADPSASHLNDLLQEN